MKIPLISSPFYEVVLPISGKKLKYRPFLVREQKILLLALESGDEAAMVSAISQVMKNCVVDEVIVDELPLTDFEFLFLKMRAVSVSEFSELKFRCLHEVQREGEEGSGECGNITTIPLNLNEITIEPVKEKANVVTLSTSPILGVTLKYPSYALMEKFKGVFDFEKTVDMVKECIENIFDAENVYSKTQYSSADLDEWIDGLTQEQFNNILAFFETIPTLKKDLEFQCRECGHKEIIHLEGVQSFFV